MSSSDCKQSLRKLVSYFIFLPVPMNQILETLLRRGMNRTKNQKIFLIYTIIVICMILAFPLFRIQEIDAVVGKVMWFFGSGMIWLQIVIIVASIKLIALAVSTKLKKTAYSLIGRNNSEHMDNILILGAMLLVFLTISEVIGFYGNQISGTIQPTFWFLLLELTLLGGIIWQLMLTRIAWKKTTKKATSATTKIPQEVDESHKERIFSTNHQDKRLEGFFGENE